MLPEANSHQLKQGSSAPVFVSSRPVEGQALSWKLAGAGVEDWCDEEGSAALGSAGAVHAFCPASGPVHTESCSIAVLPCSKAL